MSLQVTFQISKPSVLPQDREEVGEASPLRPLQVLGAAVRGQLHPDGPPICHEVQLIEERRLVPGRQLAGGKRETSTTEAEVVMLLP